MFSASFRHGITTETTGISAFSASGAAGEMLVWASVLIGLGRRRRFHGAGVGA